MFRYELLEAYKNVGNSSTSTFEVLDSSLESVQQQHLNKEE
jgi:hypothetical protein